MGEMAELKPLFETKQAKGRAAFRVFTATVLVGICLMLVYRFLHIPRGGEEGRWAWIGMLVAEVLFSFYWIITQSARWNVTQNFPFIQRLSQRYEDRLPGVDVFVCTADPIMEPPTLVVNTVLSVMSFNYPPGKLSVYLSDDGGSEFTFYALLEASHFSKSWIPFCKKFNVAPMSPEAYFSHQPDEKYVNQVEEEWLAMKKKYKEMRYRIESVMAKGSISEEIRRQHKGFLEWYNYEVTKQNHQSIVQIIIDGKDTYAVDNEGCRLPTLVYMAREKRPGWPHNFKAGAMNALIRVSSEISNGSIILNLDCDMYANNPDAVREALCFFMDEKRGPEIAFMQHPQRYNNITKNDIYGNCAHVVHQVELAGVGGYDAALFCGTACFHRRESLSGAKYSRDCRENVDSEAKKIDERTADELEKISKVLASCSYEKDTPWGKEMGLLYGCPVEDIVTGLAIQCRGWKSVYYDPDWRAFIGVAPITLDTHLVQFKRWSEGLFQIFFSKYCPFIYGHGKIKVGAQMGYCVYLLWAPVSLPTLYYIIVPPLCLLHGISLFPKVSSPWFIPFAYVFIAKNVYSIIEALNCDSTLKGWWNLQRMLLIRRTTSFFFAFFDVILKQLGLSQTAFALTAKVVTEDVLERYEQEVMEFGTSSLMFTIISTLAMLNLFSVVAAIFKMIFQDFGALEKFVLQVILCGLTVVLNFPIYEALFIRKDKGSLPFSVMFKSIAIAALACLILVN